MKKITLIPVISLLLLSSFSLCFSGFPERTDIFQLQHEHVHGSTLAECPNGDIIAAWFQGSGERWADDVRIMGARLKKGSGSWSKPFLMADVPDFPDINPVLFVDQDDELWLVWYTVIANQWETSLLKYRKSRNYMQEGPPEWYWQDDILVKPGGLTERGIQPGDRFVESVKRQLKALDSKYVESSGPSSSVAIQTGNDTWSQRKSDLLAKAGGENMLRKGYIYKPDGSHTEQLTGYPYFRRMGWQTRNKPFIEGQRIILPLYSDGFSISLMAITDNQGRNWSFSDPLVENGNIQPAIAQKADGSLIALMRDAGPAPKRLHFSESKDHGNTWSIVEDSAIPNPGSGADMVTLSNGHWVLIYNDTESGRHSLAVSVSVDDGLTWSEPVTIENDTREENATRSHYPAIIEGSDGRLHAVYSYHRNDVPESRRGTIRYAVFTEGWAIGTEN